MKTYLNDIAAVVLMDEVPLPWDQTGLNFVPVSEWTMEIKGSRRVEVAGLKDKIAVFAGSTDGNFLPPQLIYSGLTTKSLQWLTHQDIVVSGFRAAGILDKIK